MVLTKGYIKQMSSIRRHPFLSEETSLLLSDTETEAIISHRLNSTLYLLWMYGRGHILRACLKIIDVQIIFPTDNKSTCKVKESKVVLGFLIVAHDKLTESIRKKATMKNGGCSCHGCDRTCVRYRKKPVIYCYHSQVNRTLKREHK